ncbi:putative ankyrin repeat protein RF_0381 [Phymastichus coffea]|uniref:putative ankyrin repeat protein RF_0381 n=1 Tax=Phymastichus coffea TaxID=108790 RepID=UPI00273CB5A2|nr:putative ankyrin repeat protein RF_0381 [Phymastichus coffea]XP_058802786.1 putative ankyrin repeat protein RF_0381 [Phymastichus coffea]
MMNTRSSLLHIRNGRAYFDDELLHNIRTSNFVYLRNRFENENPKNLVDLTGSTLLHFSVIYSSVTVIRFLISLGINIDAQDILGRTPLMIAIEKKISHAIATLLDANASIDIADADGETVLSKFYMKLPQLSLFVARIFFQKVDCNSPEDIKMIANNLLNIGCPGYSVLLENIAVLKLFLENGIEVDNCNSLKGDTALHIAVKEGRLEQVKLLIEYGVDVNKTNYIGNTPLMQFWHKNFDVLRALIDQGLILTACNSTGQMQTFYGLSYGSKEVVHLLLQYTDLTVRDMNGQNSLHYLMTNQNPEICRVLKGKKLDVNVVDKDGISPLHLAVQNSNLEVVKFLLDRGANANLSKNGTGITPLFMIFESYKILRDMKKCIEILLEHGADAQFVTNQGTTIFDAILNLKIFFESSYDMVMKRRRYISLSKPILAHLAALEFSGTPINDIIRNKINRCSALKKHFNIYRKQLKQAKKILHPEILTMSLKYLTVNEDKVIRLAKNIKLVSKLLRLTKLYCYKSHYSKKLFKRLLYSCRMAVLREKAIRAICRIIGPTNNFYDVSDQIIRYLNIQDWRNLNRVQHIYL